MKHHLTHAEYRALADQAAETFDNRCAIIAEHALDVTGYDNKTILTVFRTDANNLSDGVSERAEDFVSATLYEDAREAHSAFISLIAELLADITV